MAGPTQKPRAALGEIGNIAVNKEVQKKVKYDVGSLYSDGKLSKLIHVVPKYNTNVMTLAMHSISLSFVC